MTIGISIFLFAVGAILAFAVRATFEAFDVTTIGYILMVAGAIGFIATMVMANGRSALRRTTVVDDSPVIEDRVVRERRL